jgi:hypothetical protein
MSSQGTDRPQKNANDVGEEDLARLIDDFAERIRRGEALDWVSCLKAHPRHAEALKQLAPAIEALAKYGGVERATRSAPGGGEGSKSHEG